MIHVDPMTYALESRVGMGDTEHRSLLSADGSPKMESHSIHNVPATQAHATPDAGGDLVIVVLNELACVGHARSCQLSGADYAGTIPAA
jgi:hypothetical protein